jgi:hypothetical protein
MGVIDIPRAFRRIIKPMDKAMIRATFTKMLELGNPGVWISV